MYIMSQAMRLQAFSSRRDNLPMIGSSAPLQEMKRMLACVASSNCTTLITGETGTGKELAAEFIHRNSARRAYPFICINCAAIPDTLLESELFGHSRGAFTGANESYEGSLTAANGGTVFLDEIGDMSLFAQAKILRVLEKKEICRVGATRPTQLDIRFIAATNQNLAEMVERGTFRKDLYFRLNVAHVHVPALRERQEDVQALLEHFAREYSPHGSAHGSAVRPMHGSPGSDGYAALCTSPLEFSEDCLRFLLRYDWPGNVRELRNLVECLSISERISPIDASQLPRHFGLCINDERAPGGGELPDNPERDSLLSALLWAKGNKSAAAKRLRWSRMTLYRKIAKHKLFNMPPEAFEDSALRM
jgi:two-component system response regulator HydG/two-component system response regulator AtoC